MGKTNEARSTFVKAVQLRPVGTEDEINHAWSWIRKNQYNQHKIMNIMMGQMAANFWAHGGTPDVLSDPDFKEKQKAIQSYKNPAVQMYRMEPGMRSCGCISQRLKLDFNTAISSKMPNSVFKGTRKFPEYKRTYPLLVDSQFINSPKSGEWGRLKHPYSDHTEFMEHLFKTDLKVEWYFVNDIILEVVFGSPRKSRDLRLLFQGILEGHYLVQQSQLYIKKKDPTVKGDHDKIMLNLTVSKPKEDKPELDENTVVGVDVGYAIPAVCALNNNYKERAYIGSGETFTHERGKYTRQRKSLQRNLRLAKGGHGREKKLRALNRLGEREHLWAQTYNHRVSKEVVKFALDNNAKYINLENLKGLGEKVKSDKLLGRWTYFELQQFITYKAKAYGIEVRKIDPAYTSQTCNCCGNQSSGQRKTQSTFICSNPECKLFGQPMNADYNAARNIAMSEKFVKDDNTAKDDEE